MFTIIMEKNSRIIIYYKLRGIYFKLQNISNTSLMQNKKHCNTIAQYNNIIKI